MRSKGAGLALAGTLGLSGLVGGVVLAPALATAATSQESAGDAVASRVDRLRQALSGLVTDETLTQAQADAKEAELAERIDAAVEREGLPHRGRGPRGGPPPGQPAEPQTEGSVFSS